MKMNLSVSSDLISGSERALNMMRECGVLTIPKPTAAHQLIRRADAEVVAKGIYKVSKEATELDRRFFADKLIDKLSAVIRWGYRTVDAASVSYILEKIDPKMREACYKELARTLKSYSFTDYDRKRLTFLASYAGLNNMKMVAICMMASLRGGVSLDPDEKGSDIMADIWDNLPDVPDYLFCYQKPITSAMSPNTRSLLNEIVARATAA